MRVIALPAQYGHAWPTYGYEGGTYGGAVTLYQEDGQAVRILPVSREVYVSWEVHSSVYAAQDAIYDVASRIEGEVPVKFHVAAVVDSSHTLRYEVWSRATSERDVSWVVDDDADYLELLGLL